jgi:hypothetical protein
MSILPTFDYLYALRLSYIDEYYNYVPENIIIDKLKHFILNIEPNEIIVKEHLINFYKYFDIDISNFTEIDTDNHNNHANANANEFKEQMLEYINSISNMINTRAHNYQPMSMNVNHVQSPPVVMYLPIGQGNPPFNNQDMLNMLNIIQSIPQVQIPVQMHDVVNILDEKDRDKIVKTILTEDLNSDCSVCMGKLEKDETIATLPCTHTFHDECIDTYLNKYNYICPVCRKAVGNSSVL